MIFLRGRRSWVIRLNQVGSQNLPMVIFQVSIWSQKSVSDCPMAHVSLDCLFRVVANKIECLKYTIHLMNAQVRASCALCTVL